MVLVSGAETNENFYTILMAMTMSKMMMMVTMMMMIRIYHALSSKNFGIL